MATANIKAIITAEDRASAALKGFGNNVAGVGRKVASSLVQATKAAAALAATFTAFVGGMVLKGGISRALNIEDAQAKLKGLGHTTEGIEKIMDSALKSVLGTAYGLDAAATAAASAVAAGVKPGKELTKYLTTVGDAATIAGVSFNEMSSIFGKVQTQQRAYTMEINQLADRGIPIYQWLQEELGLTQEALRDMVADGKVDSETYFKVIQKNIGGAALESGKTTRGAWENTKAAMSRVGAAIVKDIIPKVRAAFGDITKWFDDNSDRIVDSANLIGESIRDAFKFALPPMKNFIGSAIEVARQVADYLLPKLNALWNNIKEELIPVLKDLWENVLKPLAPVFGTVLVVAIGLAVDALNIIIEVLGFFHQAIVDGNPIIIGLIGLFGTLAAAMAFNAVFNALTIGFTTLRLVTIPSAMASIGALQAAILTPIVMPAIVIAAALAAIMTVKNAYSNLRAEMDKTDQAIGNLNRQMDESIQKGKLTLEQAYKIQNSPGYTGKRTVSKQETSAGTIYAPQFATGTSFASGGMSLVGERGPERVDLPRGSKVYPNDKTRKMMGGDTFNFNVNVGMYAGTEQEKRKIAESLMRAWYDLKKSNPGRVTP